MTREVDRFEKQDGRASAAFGRTDVPLVYAANDISKVNGRVLSSVGTGCSKAAVLMELAGIRDLLRSQICVPPKRPALHSMQGREPRLPGTTIPVLCIAALIKPIAGGRLDLSLAETGFPALSRDQILTAFRHSRACLDVGRDNPANRLKMRLERIEHLLAPDRGPTEIRTSERIESALHSRQGIEPLLPGTTISVRCIAALIKPVAGGRLDVSDAETGFPGLSRDQILTAFRHSRACLDRAGAIRLTA